jgi:hypothetical protein
MLFLKVTRLEIIVGILVAVSVGLIVATLANILTGIILG